MASSFSIQIPAIKQKTEIRGFGNSFIKKARRIARSIRNEIQ